VYAYIQSANVEYSPTIDSIVNYHSRLSCYSVRRVLAVSFQKLSENYAQEAGGKSSLQYFDFLLDEIVHYRPT